MAAVVEQKQCICVEFGDTNNNKVWKYTLYDDGTALTEWGRVGKGLQSKLVSQSQAETKWREKTNPNNAPDKRYTEVRSIGNGENVVISSLKDVKLAAVAKAQIKHSNPIVQNLIDYLVKVNAHNIMSATGGKIQYDSSTAQFKTPLGVIDPSQVAEARVQLVKIAKFVKDMDYFNRDFYPALNQYLRLIPHDVGMMKISPQLIFPDFSKVEQENDLLDGLETSFNSVISSHPKGEIDTPKIFDVELDLINDDGIWKHVNSFYEKNKKTMHQSYKYKLKRIYRIVIPSVINNFEKNGKSLGNIRELFHGSKCSNVLSILKQGLIIPPASSNHCTGRMFGNGVYASDISSKALNYATNQWGSGGVVDKIFMFLVDFAMGNEYKVKNGGSLRDYPPKGYDSVFAEAGRSGVINNEMIVYKLFQVNLKYLLEFE